MGRSSSRRWIVLWDRMTLKRLAVRLALYVMPLWREGRLRPAFWITFLAALLHVYTSRQRGKDEA